jgi:hypothetical protein
LDDGATEAGAGLKVWVLVIEDSTYGLSASVHASEEQAWESLDQFVRDCWQAQVGEEPLPVDREERIQVYFDRTQEHAFHIQGCELLAHDLYPLDRTRDVIETQEEHLRWQQ